VLSRKGALLSSCDSRMLWLVSSDKLLYYLPPAPPSKRVVSVLTRGHFSPDDRYLLCGQTVFDVKARRVVLNAELREGFDRAEIEFSPRGRYLVERMRHASWTEPGISQIHDLSSGQRVPVPGDPDEVSISDDEQWVASSDSTNLLVASLPEGRPAARFSRSLKPIQYVSTKLYLAPHGDAVVEVRGNRMYLVARDRGGWEQSTPRELTGHAAPIETVYWLDDGRSFLSVSTRWIVHRVSDGRSVELIYVDTKDPPGALLTVSSDGMFDGPASAIEALAFRIGPIAGGRIEPATAMSHQYSPGLFASFRNGGR
jgi:hypothetical protein